MWNKFKVNKDFLLLFIFIISFRLRKFYDVVNMEIPTINKYINSLQNKFIMETNALEEPLIYLLKRLSYICLLWYEVINLILLY